MAKSTKKTKVEPDGDEPVAAIGMDKSWQCESDASCLQRAAEVRADPKRMKAVKEWAQKRLDEINNIAKLGD
jgi:hypothetical protein